MRRARGFTIVELVVVMVIMAILMTLATFGLSTSQKNARDAERKSDIGAISRGLETRYKEGNPDISVHYEGSYPDITEMAHIMGATVAGFTPTSIAGGYSNDALPGTSVNNFTPPDVDGAPYTGFTMPTCAGTCALSEATDDGSSAGHATTKDQYYYEPINASGNVCNVPGTCVRYNLYWHTEADNTTHLLRSQHQ